jgi:hypothetical protein
MARRPGTDDSRLASGVAFTRRIRAPGTPDREAIASRSAISSLTDDHVDRHQDNVEDAFAQGLPRAKSLDEGLVDPPAISRMD